MRALIIMNFISKAQAKFASLVIGAIAFASTSVASAAMNVTNVTDTITNLGTILGALVQLLQTVIVNNIDVFITIIVLIMLLGIIKRFGGSFSDFFEGILSGLFRRAD